jgi:phosphoribosyl 1,2-cyclic phosphate phosphodiesterase
MENDLLYPTELLFLGSGTSAGVPEIGCACSVCQSTNAKDKRFRASVLLRSADEAVLIDCGPDFRQQMLVQDIKKLDAILLTHEHYDHMSGLDDVRPLGATNVYAQSRVLSVIKNNMPYSFAANNLNLNLPKLMLHEISDEPFLVDKWLVQPILLTHMRLTILGFRINNVAYLTDFNYIPETEFDKLKNLDVLVLDALRLKPHPSHNTLQQALAFVEKIKPQEAYFTHMSHDMGLHEEVEKNLPQHVHLAYDGLRVKL